MFLGPKVWFIFRVSLFVLRFPRGLLIVTIFFLMSLSIIVASKFLFANLNICVILDSISINVWTTFFCFFFSMSGNFGVYSEHCECFFNLHHFHSTELRHELYM